MKEVQFTVYGPPGAKGRPRFGKGGFAYTPKKTVAYENLVKVEYGAQTDHYRFPDEAYLDLHIMAYYPIPKSVSKKRRQEMIEHKIRPAKKPDFDNVGKIIADSLNEIAYHDDVQIVDCQIRKFYAEEPRIDVRIIQVGEDPTKKKSGGAKS